MKRYKIINKKRFIIGMTIMAIIMGIIVSFAIDFICYTESYLPTWRYQLYNDIKDRNPEAIELYERRYVANNRDLFDDNFEIRNIYIKGEN